MNISRLRKHKGLTQTELAGILGRKQTAVSKWECGEAAPPASLLPKICEVLGCTLDDLFAEEEEDEDTPAENAPRAET